MVGTNTVVHCNRLLASILEERDTLETLFSFVPFRLTSPWGYYSIVRFERAIVCSDQAPAAIPFD